MAWQVRDSCAHRARVPWRKTTKGGIMTSKETRTTAAVGVDRAAARRPWAARRQQNGEGPRCHQRKGGAAGPGPIRSADELQLDVERHLGPGAIGGDRGQSEGPRGGEAGAIGEREAARPYQRAKIGSRPCLGGIEADDIKMQADEPPPGEVGPASRGRPASRAPGAGARADGRLVEARATPHTRRLCRLPKRKGPGLRPAPIRKPALTLGDAYAFCRSSGLIGSARMRLPVAAKIALARAGAKGGTPGSPTPDACTEKGCSTMWVATISG